MVEHDADEIWENTLKTIGGALADAGLTAADLAVVGITNQRESVLVRDRRTGRPCHHVIVWQDTRTAGMIPALDADLLRERTGLPPVTYFSATKVRWLLDHIPGLRARAEAGEVVKVIEGVRGQGRWSRLAG
jgi:glycerol kinase